MEIAIGIIIGVAAGLVLYLVGRREIAPLREEASELRSELDAVRPSIQEHEIARATADTQLAERTERLDAVESELHKAQEQTDAIRSEHSKLRSQLSESNATSEERRQQLGQLQVERNEARRLLSDSGEQLATAQSRLSETEAVLPGLREQTTTLTSERDEARRLLSDSGEQLAASQSRLSETEALLSGLREQTTTLTSERDEARQLLSQREASLSSTRERISEAEETIANQLAQIRVLTEERENARTESASLRTETASLNAKLRGFEADQAARREELETYRTELESRFKGIATTVTETTREQFIKEFRDLSKQQSESSLELVGNTVKPLRESLERLDKGAQDMEKARENAYADLRRTLLDSNEAIGQLRQEASGLRQALRSPQVRGLWGEQQLQNVLEASGLREHVDFHTQVSVSDGEGGASRPDVVVQIPGQRSVVIDAKTPLDSYLGALEAADQQSEQTLLNAHAASLLKHARSLGQKDYSHQLEDALDFVILFVPSDAILDAALRVRPDLFEHAWREHRVLMAAPGSLIAFLRAVAEVWRQQTVQQNAVEIATSARELYDRLSTYSDHLDKMGRSLGQTVAHYNRGVGSFQSRVLSSARKIEQLSDIEETRRIDEPSPLEVDVRQLTAPELAQVSSAEADASAAVTEPAKLTTEPVTHSPAHVQGPVHSQESTPTPSEAAGREVRNIRVLGGLSLPEFPVRKRSHRMRPTGFILWGDRHEAQSMVAVLFAVAEQIHSRHAHDFDKATEIRGSKRQYFSKSRFEHHTPRQIGSSEYWLEANLNPPQIERVLEQMLEKFGYSPDELVIRYDS